MPRLATQLASAVTLLAVSGAALAAPDSAIALPEPGVLSLLAVAVVAGWAIHKRPRK
jgi:hypothetical protein